MPFRRVRKKKKKSFFERLDADSRYLLLVKVIVWTLLGLGAVLSVVMIWLMFP